MCSIKAQFSAIAHHHLLSIVWSKSNDCEPVVSQSIFFLGTDSCSMFVAYDLDRSCMRTCFSCHVFSVERMACSHWCDTLHTSSLPSKPPLLYCSWQTWFLLVTLLCRYTGKKSLIIKNFEISVDSMIATSAMNIRIKNCTITTSFARILFTTTNLTKLLMLWGAPSTLPMAPLPCPKMYNINENQTKPNTSE